MKKKLKKSHPIVVNLGKVEDALHDHGVDVPGSKLNRKMLIEAVPRALGDGAAVDERHQYQKIIVDAIGEIFSAEVKKWSEKVAAAQSEMNEVNTQKASEDSILAEKQKILDDKKCEIQTKKATNHANIEAVKDAKHALKEATAEVEHFDDNMKKKEDTKTKYETAVNVTLAGLIKGEYENPKEKKAAEGKGMETLKTLLEEAGVDDSLNKCFPAALQKKPEDRGSFDTTVIGEIQKRLNKQIAALASELAQGPALKAKKEAEAKSAEAVKDAAIAAQEASAEALRVAESEKPDLDSAVKTATHDVKEIEKVQDAKSKKLAKDQAGLEEANASQEAWKFLSERDSTTPEEEEPPPAEEAKDAPMEEVADTA
jgi:hypothetical protein